jgi:hypothetical protein
VLGGCVIHSFRHSLRDGLRAVECPLDIIDAIGGWTTTGVGQQYDLGQPLDAEARWMNKLVPNQWKHSFIAPKERKSKR